MAGKRTEYEPTIQRLKDGRFGVSRIEIDGDERMIHIHSAHDTEAERDTEVARLRANSGQ